MEEQERQVLVVSDDKGVRASVREALAGLAVAVLEAADAAQAAGLLASLEVDLVLVDAGSKGFDGAALCREFQRSARPLVALVPPGVPPESIPALDRVNRLGDPAILQQKADLLLRVGSPAASAASPDPAATVAPAKVEARIRRIQELGACPFVVTKLLQVSRKSRTGARDIAAVIGTDHALASKVLKIANSALYGAKGRIAQISQAVTRIGFRGVMDLATGISVLENFRQAGSGGFDRYGFWRHSLGVGLSARRLARMAGWPIEEEAFVAGLLHDIGKPLLSECFPAEYRRALETAAGLRAPIRSAERELFGADHPFLGSQLLRSWGLPQDLTDAVAYHHNLERMARAERGEGRRLMLLVHVADAFCKAMRIGHGGDDLLEETSGTVSSECGLSMPRGEELLRDVERDLVEYQEFLEMPPSQRPGGTGGAGGAGETERPQALSGMTVDVLVGSGRRFSLAASFARAAGAEVRLADGTESFSARIAAEPPHGAILDTPDGSANLRMLERLEGGLADRTVCFVEFSALRRLRKETAHPAALFARPADGQELLIRLAGQTR